MKVLNISRKEFDKLQQLQLDGNIFNSECTLYILKDKINKKYAFKKLYNDSGFRFSNKLFTLNELIDNNSKINMDTLVMPKRLVAIDNKVSGFIMPYINGINFQTVLDSNNYLHEDKIEYLKQIGIILEQMKKVRETTDIEEFYLNDIHENNFVLDKQTNTIKVVDMDSCKINGNYTFPSRYLSIFSNISNFSKYEKEKECDCGGYYKPNEDTDLYCYIIMILNYISDARVNSLTMENFWGYLLYLRNMGISYELLDKIALIYSNEKNINIYEYLDELCYFEGKTSYKKYTKSK